MRTRGLRCEAMLAGVLVWVIAGAALAQAPVRISGRVMEGALVRREVPVYPDAARAAGVWGAVVLHAVIDPEGRVDSLNVVSGPEVLRDAALKAVWYWKYRPYQLNGRPRAVDTTVTVKFSPDDPQPAGPPGGGTPTPPAKPPRGPVRISRYVMAGLLLTRVAPIYPEEARRHGVSGIVVLHAILGKDGRVFRLSVLSGPEMLRKATLDAVSQWTYRPYILNGDPIEVETTIQLDFQTVASPGT